MPLGNNRLNARIKSLACFHLSSAHAIMGTLPPPASEESNACRAHRFHDDYSANCLHRFLHLHCLPVHRLAHCRVTRLCPRPVGFQPIDCRGGHRLAIPRHFAQPPFAGRATDTLGSKRSIVFGLWGICISGALTLLATLLEDFATASLTILIVARLFLGVSQGLIGVGTINWCIGKVGAEHTARSISERHCILWRHRHWRTAGRAGH